MDDVAKLIAIEEIKALKARYFRAIDTKDWALLRAVFADDVICDYRGSDVDPATGVGFAGDATSDLLRGNHAAVEAMEAALQGVVTAHQGFMPEIEITGERSAKAVWAMYDLLKLPAGAPLAELEGFGHYHETYDKSDGAWRIKTIRLSRLRVNAA